MTFPLIHAHGGTGHRGFEGNLCMREICVIAGCSEMLTINKKQGVEMHSTLLFFFLGSPFLCLSGDTVTSEREGTTVGNCQIQQREEKARDWGSVQVCCQTSRK